MLRAYALVAGLLMVAAGAAQADRASLRKAADEPAARVIVKFRDAPGSLAVGRSAALRSRIDTLAARQAVSLRLARSVSDSTHALWLDRPLRGADLERLLGRLAADPAIEYAEPDRRRYRAAIPNDPLFNQAPETGQWWLTTPNATFVSAIDGPAAWNLTTGDAGIVVAVLDTGAMFDHPDLGRARDGGKFLDGYDFVGGAGDADAIRVANDGDGRDPDPSDPGDWISSADRRQPVFSDCDVADSSWHGVHIAGIIGARTGNGTGGAGIGWNTPILPVRVLGKCFGYDSDIIAGMRWAAGLPVPGVPANPTPARVLNLSLGALGVCPLSYRNAVDELRARNVLVVAAAGNDGEREVTSPGNCPGVVSVTALRHVGTKVGFANYGPAVTIAAPGGNCVNVGLNQPCLYPIVSADNAGARGPGEMIYGGKLGTSFSTPMVAGVAALMLSRDPLLDNDQLIARLRLTSRVFPARDPALLDCSDPLFVPDDDGNLPDDGQCNCTPTSCGEGMLDAGRAARSATHAVAVVRGPAAALAGVATPFDGSDSLPAPRRQLTSFQWTVVSGPAGGGFDNAAAESGGSSGGGGGALSWLHLAALAGLLVLAQRRRSAGGR